MNKEIIRKEFKAIRNNIENKKEKSKLITEKLLNLSEVKVAKLIGIYMSFSSEVDTKDLIEQLLMLGKNIVIPRIYNNIEMEFYKFNSINDLKNKNILGILEPENNKENKASKDDIDLMIIPGIWFDLEKNRVGLGKGYYDRYLKNSNIKKIGICFDEQLLTGDTIDTNKYDIKMDKIVTNKRII